LIDESLALEKIPLRGFFAIEAKFEENLNLITKLHQHLPSIDHTIDANYNYLLFANNPVFGTTEQ